MHRRLTTALLALFILVYAFSTIHAQTGSCEAGFRLIQHTMGETCIPENVERVVALEWTYVEDILALGLQPVGIADIEGYHNWVKIPPALDENVVDVGTRNEPNLEAIAELNPDLIIGVQFRVTENYDDLSAIAPTLVFNPYPDDLTVSQYAEMIKTFSTIATVLNRDAAGEAVLAQMQATYDRARTALEDAGRGGEAFILSQGWTYDNAATFRLFTDNAMAVQILKQLGLENAWDDAPQLYGFTEIGIEGFAALKDDDFNFFYVAQEADNDFFVASPLWSSLNFVASDKAYWMGGDVWLFGGPLSAEVMVATVLNGMGIELPAAEAAPEAVTCEADFRAVTDAAGIQICIPAHPQRVIALMESDLDALLALGVQPVGTTNGRGQPTPPRYLADRLNDITIVGEFYNPNLELVLGLDPDLILFGGFTDVDVLAQLNAIAPTVNTFNNGESWQSHLLRVGDVMNMPAEAQAFITAYDERVKAIQGKLGANTGAEFIVARWSAEGPQVMAPTTFSSRVLIDLGLTPPAEIPDLQAGHPHSAPLSLEAVDILDVDWAFIGTLSSVGDAVEALATALENPLFQSLKVVQNEHVVVIDGSLWTSIGGPLAATLVLDNVEAALIPAGE